MFGRRNKIEKQIKEVFAQIKDQRDEFEEKVDTIEEGREQMHADVGQAILNINHLADYADQNVQEEAALIHDMDELSKELSTVADAYKHLAEKVKEQHEAVTNLVEDNKHFTTPSKYLTEAPAKIRKGYQTYEAKLDEFAESGRQMSVMALNAAIEAGRLGTSAQQFVEVSEEIRQMALEYEQSALSMKEELQTAEGKINELEEFVFRLVALIKDSNVATTKLLKKSVELNRRATDFPKHDFTDDIVDMRTKVVAMRNLDEEIIKASERNKIQLKDIQQDIQDQKKELRELESDLSYIFDEGRFIHRL